EHEDVLHRDDVALHASHFCHGDELPGSAGETLRLNHQMTGGREPLADRPNRQLKTGQHHHGLNARDSVARAVGVDGRERAVVASVHGLEHVERFGTAALTAHNPVGAHTKTVDEQVANG